MFHSWFSYFIYGSFHVNSDMDTVAPFKFYAFSICYLEPKTNLQLAIFQFRIFILFYLPEMFNNVFPFPESNVLFLF